MLKLHWIATHSNDSPHIQQSARYPKQFNNLLHVKYENWDASQMLQIHWIAIYSNDSPHIQQSTRYPTQLNNLRHIQKIVIHSTICHTFNDFGGAELNWLRTSLFFVFFFSPARTTYVRPTVMHSQWEIIYKRQRSDLWPLEQILFKTVG